MVLALGSATVQAAWGDPKDSGQWQLINQDRSGQKTFLDSQFFQAGQPASFLVKTDQVPCRSRFRQSTCTSVALYQADCQVGKLAYSRSIIRDVMGNVIAEYPNPNNKLVYPHPGGTMETVLIAACKRNRVLLRQPPKAASKAQADMWQGTPITDHTNPYTF